MSAFKELRQLTVIRVLLFLREPEAVFWVFVFPLVLALVLGLAFKDRAAETVKVGMVEGQLRETWTAALTEAEGIEIVVYPNGDTAERKLGRGAVTCLVSDAAPGEGGAAVEVRFDPSRTEAENARLRVTDAIQRAAGRVDPVEVATSEVTEHGSRYIDFLIPGLLGMNLMGTGIWGTGFAIVDMRQKKLLKRFLVTPMRKSSFLLAQMLSRFIFLIAEVSAITLFGCLILGVPFRGSWPLFALLCSVGALCFSGLGLLIGSRARTMEGVSGLMNFAMMPMWLLSGVFFSYEKFPEFLHPAIRLIPLTATNDALRGLMLEGSGLGESLPAIGVQLVWTVVTFWVALRIFRWS